MLIIVKLLLLLNYSVLVFCVLLCPGTEGRRETGEERGTVRLNTTGPLKKCQM